MLAETQLEDSVQRVDDVRARLFAAAALAQRAGDLGDRRDDPAVLSGSNTIVRRSDWLTPATLLLGWRSAKAVFALRRPRPDRRA